MCNKRLFAGFFVFLTFTAACAVEPEWPILLNGRNVPECTTALQYAQAAYRSTVSRLADYRDAPVGLESTLVPWGDTTIFTKVESSTFDVIDKERWAWNRGIDPQRRNYSILWQTNTTTRTRLVFTVGLLHSAEVYGVDLIPVSWTPAQYDEVAQHPMADDGIAEAVPGSYLPHHVFQRKDKGNLWLVYLGEPYEFFPTWRVYVSVENRYQEACQIQFRPPMNHASLLLPAAVQQLDRLILRSMGRPRWYKDHLPAGSEEINGNVAWANAALRPWAMGTPWQTREQVDKGLVEWSKRGPAYQAQYAGLLAQYTRAEQALVAYYLTRFTMSPYQAQSTAKNALDIAFRSHYSF